MSEMSSGETYRKRQADALAFYQIIQQLESDEVIETPTGAEVFLDGIATHGISGAAELALDGLEPPPELYTPADPSKVLEYLTWVHTMPPIVIKDLGAVDREIVIQTGLTDNYIEEIRGLLEFVDPTKRELSVLEFPEVRQKMRATELEGFKKLITVLALDMHGIAFVIDDEDSRAWSKLRKLAEDISSEVFRDYSQHLRNRKAESQEKTPMRDVLNNMEDILDSRQRAIDLAMGNIDASAWEKRRLYETLPERVREQLNNFFAEVNELSPEELPERDLNED
jgi:hypothetical protein